LPAPEGAQRACAREERHTCVNRADDSAIAWRISQHRETAGEQYAPARSTHAWLAAGGARAPIRAALIRFWTRHGVLRLPVPLTGAAALRAEASFEPVAWLAAFLEALAGAAIDLLAAAPLLSATTLAAALGVAMKTAIRLLDFPVAAGIVVEVTRRSKRRLFGVRGLEGMESLADAVRPPHRPEPGRRTETDEDVVAGPPPPLPPLTPIERRAFGYSPVEQGMLQLDLVIRRTGRSLDARMRGARTGATSVPTNGDDDP